MASQKPTIVIISGGWHTPSSYAKLTTALTTAGYKVHVPRLPSMNESRPPTADLTTDTTFVRAYVQDLISNGHNVFAIMHSYGGQVGTNALCGLGLGLGLGQGSDEVKSRGRVSHLVYMTAFAQPEGWSMVDKVEEFNHGHLIPLAFDFADDQTVVSRDAKGLLVSGTTLAEEEVDAYVGGMVRWNGKCMYDRIEGAAWRDIPVSYIYATMDMTVPLEYQKSMVEGMRKAGREVDTYEVATGHCPHFTATMEVVGAIEKIVAKVMGNE